jgi:hypothetical protein
MAVTGDDIRFTVTAGLAILVLGTPPDSPAVGVPKHKYQAQEQAPDR